MTSWWAFDAKDPAALAFSTDVVPPGSPGEDGPFHQLEFGDLPFRLGRKTALGEATTVLAALRAECRRSVERGACEQREPGPEERKMLAGLAGMTPVEQVSGEWQMYQLDRPLPLVAVTSAKGQPDAADPGSATARVLCWGFALPSGANGAEWTLFTGVPTDDSAESAADPLRLPLPAGARRQVLLRGEAGEGVLLFSGAGDAQRWRSSLDDWFRQSGWRSEERWRMLGDAWGCRYASSEGCRMADLLLEVQGELRVMITVTQTKTGVSGHP